MKKSDNLSQLSLWRVWAVVSTLACSPASSCSGSDLIGFMCGNVFQSHTCEIPPHLLPISSGHNTQQREESPQPIDSLDRSPTFIAAEKKRLAATQRTLHYPSLFLPPQFSISSVFFVHLFIHFYFGHLIFLSICYSHEQHLALFILKLEFLHQSFLLRCSQSSLRIYPFCESQPSTFHTYIVFLFSSNSSYFPHPLPNSVSFSV